MASLLQKLNHPTRPNPLEADSVLPASGRERVEFLALVVAMTVFTTGPVYVVAVRVFSAEGTWEDSWIKYTFIAASAVGCAVWASMAHAGRLRRPGVALFIAGAYTTLAILSTLWSVLAYYTLWRSLTYAGLLATAWALASFRYRTFISFLISLCGLGTVLSVVAVVAVPDVGRDGTDIWRGIYTNPNSLGPVCALLVISLLARALETGSARQRAWLLIAVGATCVPLVGSGSSTAIFGLVISIGAATVAVGSSVLWSSGHRQSALITVLAAAVTAVLAALLLQRIGALDNIGKRIEVWDVVWDRIWIKPGTGYGFFTYWDTNASLSPRTLARAGSAHNSALDATLGVGFAGFALVVALALLGIGRSLTRAIRNASGRTWAWLSLTLFVVLAHVTESFVSWFSYMWILLIVVAWGQPPAEPE